MSVDTIALQAAQNKGLTVGVIPTDGSQALRLEIDDFLADADLANLYFLALEAFMKQDISSQPFSYYEISGIHGQPYRAWDKVENVPYTPTGEPPNKRGAGYCAHGSVLFPTWHRVYLAQFEQALYLHAAGIAKALGQEHTVLPRFRIPYFDPLLPREKLVDQEQYTYGIPVILMTKTVNVRRPGKTDYEPMDNPLYQFNFPNDTKGGFHWDQIRGYQPKDIKLLSTKTIRGYNKPKGTADHEYLKVTFNNQYGPTTQRSTSDAAYLYDLFFGGDPWKVISNHFEVGDRQNPVYNVNSLEGFHDNIHGYMGLGPGTSQNRATGHMSHPEVAGNIDRILAIWQGINNPKGDDIAWWDSLVFPLSTYVEPRHEPETPDTPLAPFRKAFNGDETVWWTANDVRDHTKLGYDYPVTKEASATGNPVASLRQWANIEVGWVGDFSNKNTPLLDHLKKQVTEQAPALPKTLVVDDTTRWNPNEQYLASAATTTSSIKPSFLVQATAPGLHRTVATHNPSFEDRFGGLGDLVKHGKLTRWNASFGVDKFALNGTFIIAFFLGDFAPELAGSDWLHEPNLVGSSAIFASSRDRIDGGHCANCAKQQAMGRKYYDTVGLTQALLTYWKSGDSAYDLKVSSLDPEAVTPFLTRNLHWRIIDGTGAYVPTESVPSLKIKVFSDTITLPQRLTDAPVFGNKVAHIEVTDGRPGGLNAGEQL